MTENRTFVTHPVDRGAGQQLDGHATLTAGCEGLRRGQLGGGGSWLSIDAERAGTDLAISCWNNQLLNAERWEDDCVADRGTYR